MNPGADIEVCVVAYGNETTIERCVASVGQLGPAARVAVCDNHPDGASAVAARRAADAIGVTFRALKRPDNPGFAVACNLLASTSSAEWLVFLNPDAAISAWPGVDELPPGLVGPRLVDVRGRVQHNHGLRRSMWDEVARRLQRRPRRPRGAGYVSGAAMVVRADDFRGVGGFDERYFMYYEDIDLCRRLNDAGVPVWSSDDVEVVHIGSHSASSDPEAAALRSYRSGVTFHRTWSRAPWRFSLIVLVDSALRRAVARLGVRVPGSPAAKATLRAAAADLAAPLRRRRRHGRHDPD
jgi:hypothetical protein